MVAVEQTVHAAVVVAGAKLYSISEWGIIEVGLAVLGVKTRHRFFIAEKKEGICQRLMI